MTDRNCFTRAAGVAIACFALVDTALARPGGEEGPDCGPAISVDEVRVVDTMSEDAAASMLGFGAEYTVLNGVWPYPSQGSRAQTVRAATRWAASHGCPLLVVGPEIDSENALPSMGDSTGSNSAPPAGKRYATLRVGVPRSEN